jgi:hypothetical protein
MKKYTNNLNVYKTGRKRSFNSCEYIVTFPDNSQQILWSPPWNELSDKEMDKKALEKATEIWHKKLKYCELKVA